MLYEDRLDAGRALVAQMKSYRGGHPLVLGIPRGGVPMAEVVARALEGDLDVVLVRKIGHPQHPEFGIGAIDEWGHLFTPVSPSAYGVEDHIVRAAARRELDRLAARRAAYTPHRPPLDPRDRLVIVVDDGAATGGTLVAALDSVRRRGAKRVVAAVPVASREAAELIRAHCDDAVILSEPDPFHAVGEWYRAFEQVSDAEVLDVLDRATATA